ncbi:MAG TPA: YlxR family protein [Candidatus Anoxymicrobiaceae bacterium]
MKVTLRTCVGCGSKRPKGEMIRVGAEPSWKVTREAAKLPGRGAYICPAEECLSRARKRGGLDRTLKRKVPEGIYQEIEVELLPKESK